MLMKTGVGDSWVGSFSVQKYLQVDILSLNFIIIFLNMRTKQSSQKFKKEFNSVNKEKKKKQ